ncbi:MAG: DUF2029 domain-containing protein [Spirochaetales bacterium]|nr:DUF2029 domain-containing protein [Spirochaetales bacterium]
MPQSIEFIIKIILISIVTVILLLRRRYWSTLKQGNILLFGMAIICLASYFNFGFFHTDGSFIHNWEQYHYVLGSKYFKELGYDGLYAAGLLALKENSKEYTQPTLVRDLRTNQVVEAAAIESHQKEVRNRFSDKRWKDFAADATGVFIPQDVWLDHGYNPTPAWTFIGQLFSRWLPWNTKTAYFFGFIDIILLMILFIFFLRTFGIENTLCMVILFSINYCSRFYWTGGAFLRQDWFLAAGLGFCALHKNRLGCAGAAFGYATAVRIFPVFFVVALILYFAYGFWKKRTFRKPLLFVSVFASTLVIMLVLGSFTGRGVKAWSESFDNLKAHHSIPLANDFGIDTLVYTSASAFLGDLTDPEHINNDTLIRKDIVKLKEERKILHLIITIVLSLLLIKFLIQKTTPLKAALTGMGLMFCIISPTCYYWSMLAFLPLSGIESPRDTTEITLITLFANLLIYLWLPVYFVLLHFHFFTRMSVAVFYPQIIILGVLLGFLLTREYGAKSLLSAKKMQPDEIDDIHTSHTNRFLFNVSKYTLSEDLRYLWAAWNSDSSSCV